jgi:iron complex transport system ATP-binding protein
MSLIEAENLRVRFGQTTVLDGVSVRASAGEIVTLIGPNGSGKTTLLRALAGLQPSDGEVRINRKPLRTFARAELAKVLAYLPQAPSSDATDRVREVLHLGRAPHRTLLGLESESDARIVSEVADALQLSPLLDRPLGTLSGGQRQRVFLGRALVQQPAVLLLDEPATFLDVRHQVDLHRLLRTLARERGLAIVMASHDLNLAATHADSAVLLKAGRLTASGSVGEVMTGDQLGNVFDTPMRQIEIDGRQYVVAISSDDAARPR